MDIVNMSRSRAPAARGYHHGDLRQALLSAAREILDREGVDAVTVRAVARKADVGHSAPANHFKDRAALLTALAFEIFAELAAEIDRAVGAGGRMVEQRLRVFGQAVVRYALQHPNRYRLLWRRDSLDNADSRLDESGGAIYERVRAILADNKPLKLASVDSQIIAAWSMVHGYVSLRLDGTLTAGTDEVTGLAREDAILDVLIMGLSRSKTR
jgi:AcrR family transcriptional regulator